MSRNCVLMSPDRQDMAPTVTGYLGMITEK